MNWKLALGVVGGFFGSVIVLLLLGFLLMGKMSKGGGGCPLRVQNSTATTTSYSDTDFL